MIEKALSYKIISLFLIIIINPRISRPIVMRCYLTCVPFNNSKYYYFIFNQIIKYFPQICLVLLSFQQFFEFRRHTIKPVYIIKMTQICDKKITFSYEYLYINLFLFLSKLKNCFDYNNKNTVDKLRGFCLSLIVLSVDSLLLIYDKLTRKLFIIVDTWWVGI